MRIFLQFILGVVVVGILVNLASDYLGGRFPPVQKLLVQLALMAVAVWAAILITRLALSYLIGGRYAVEALILNAHDELLLYRHPQHKCMLPPGGRVKRSEFPDFALQLRLEERLGLSPGQYRFDERFHHGLNVNFGNLGQIQRFPAPFLVQREMHRQRSFVESHYDLIYVLKLLEENLVFRSSKYSPVHFVDMDALQEMAAQGRTLPDVLDAYRRVLDIISKVST